MQLTVGCQTMHATSEQLIMHSYTKYAYGMQLPQAMNTHFTIPNLPYTMMYFIMPTHPTGETQGYKPV